MKKKKVIKINFSNKLFYTLIVLGILGIVAVGVYAVAPNPGHSASEIDFSEGIDGDLIVNGKVGIGIDNPGSLLDIKSSIDNKIIQQWINSDGRKLILTTPDADNDNSPWIWNTPNAYEFQTDSSVALYIKGNGNLGIGTTSPTAELDVNGKIKTDELCFGDDCRSDWSEEDQPISEGLYGFCKQKQIGTVYYCQDELDPSYCHHGALPGYLCACPLSYTKVQVGYFDSFNIYSCYKN